MWIFTIYGFFSVACAQSITGGIDPDTVMVRARDDRHLRRLQKRFLGTAISSAAVEKSLGADYRYRIVIPKEAWVSALNDMAKEQTWSNFKNEASAHSRLNRVDAGYVRALHQTWEIMFGLQTAREESTAWQMPER